MFQFFLIPTPVVTSSFAGTLAPTTLAATGSAAAAGMIVGSLASTTAGVTLVASGSRTIPAGSAGSLAATLGSTTLTATAVHAAVGTATSTFARTLASVTLAAAGVAVGLEVIPEADSLQEAVRLYLAADDAILAELFGGVQPDILALGSDLPAVVVVDPQDGKTEFITTAGDCIDRGTIQVSVYAEDLPDQNDNYSLYDNKRNVRRIAGLVAGALNDAPLTFQGGRLISFRQNGPPRLIVEKATGEGTPPARHQFVLFDYIISRNIYV